MRTSLRGRRTGLAVVVLAACAIVVAGCGSPQARVKGTVSIDGKPVKVGSIDFFPESGKGPTAGAPIADGKYEAVTSIGRMIVSITAAEVARKEKAYDAPDSPMLDVMKNVTPEKYYGPKSELRADLEQGANEVNFDLKVEPKKK